MLNVNIVSIVGVVNKKKKKVWLGMSKDTKVWRIVRNLKYG